ncbi:MAG: hypothetical protein GY723_03765 [bacterium]|nr:hypothetical protein [bacterium]
MLGVRSIRTLLLCCVMLAPVAASSITYQINETIGSNGSVTGFIETDGTLGNMVSGSTHFIDWNIILSASGAVALFGPLSGDNSVFIQTGQFFTATPTRLTYGVVGGSSISDFQFCLSTSTCDASTPRWTVRTFGSHAVQSLQQVGIPGTLDRFENYSAPHSFVFVPEPGLAALLAIGSIACSVAFRRRRLTGLGFTVVPRLIFPRRGL